MREPPANTAIAVRAIASGAEPLGACAEPLGAFERLRGGGAGWLLHSALRDPRHGRYSFAGSAPWAIARVRARRLELEVLRAVDPRFAPGRHAETGDPLELFRRLLPRSPRQAPPPVPFCGGAVAALGYELAAELDVHALHARDDLGLPDAVLLLVDRVLAFDHRTGAVLACGLGMADDAATARDRAECAVAGLEAALAAPPAPVARRAAECPARAPDPHAPGEAFDAAAFTKGVDRVLEEIAAGNVYQACLTGRASRPFAGDPWRLYCRLQRSNPAPFACFLELPEAAVVSSSPERFLCVDRGGTIESRPIKGTAARGRDPHGDAARRRALLGSAKDRAENLMIVDLVRNDLSRVCATGSVHVPELMAIEAYASVFQMVSTVRGRLAPGRDALDAVRAAFPPGSMTGAPKLAAMALLDRLEPVRRAFYSGAVGYLDAFGGADLSVVIRTALVVGGRAWLHAGGGVVADSDPTAELREAFDKLGPLLAALGEADAGR
jgi:para-aminobenzoate synthetase component 1